MSDLDQRVDELRQKEEQLFAEWPGGDDSDFVPDGLPDPTAYLESSPRLLFLLKDANLVKDGEPLTEKFDLREFLNKGAFRRWQTWKTVSQWICGIRALPERLNLEQVNERVETEEHQVGLLRTVAAVNLKKTAGKAKANFSTLNEYARKHGALLNRQLSLYSPELIICCGDEVSSIGRNHLKSWKDVSWPVSSVGNRFAKLPSRAVVVQHHHPQARYTEDQLYYPLIDTIREILHPGQS